MILITPIKLLTHSLSIAITVLVFQATSEKLLADPLELKLTLEGHRLLEMHHTHEAIAMFNRALAKDPHDIAALHGRAWGHLEEEKTDLAIAELTRLIALKQDYPLAYVTRAQAYFENGQTELALKDCATALSLKTDSSVQHEIYHLRGRIYRSTRQYDKAKSDFDAALKISPKDAGLYWNRGNVSVDTGQYQKAIEDYNQAIRFTKPSDEDRMARYFSSRAAAYEKLGKKDLAAADRKQINAKVSADLNEIFSDKH
jgi:tetratricopeptide (TPR) repeat protein